MESLIGTNQAKLTRIYQAYEKRSPDTHPDIKKDICAYSKLAKRLAVVEFFRQLKMQSSKIVFI